MVNINQKECMVKEEINQIAAPNKAHTVTTGTQTEEFTDVSEKEKKSTSSLWNILNSVSSKLKSVWQSTKTWFKKIFDSDLTTK